MTGQKFDFNKHCKVEIGAYVQVHKETSPMNSMKPRTIGAIALGATGNIQGSYRFLNLNTNKIITKMKFTEVPIPDYVIKWVEEIAEKEQQLDGLYFHNRIGDLAEEEEADDSDVNDDKVVDDNAEEDDKSIDNDDLFIAGVDNNEEEPHDNNNYDNSNEADHYTNADAAQNDNNDEASIDFVDPEQQQKEKYTTRHGRLIKKPCNYVPSFNKN